ncbi:hypothetical protein CB1_000993006 [Camelus ferus]|nr:hypothetical protein CB1_000993006 [Camelus ferus]
MAAGSAHLCGSVTTSTAGLCGYAAPPFFPALGPHGGGGPPDFLMPWERGHLLLFKETLLRGPRRWQGQRVVVVRGCSFLDLVHYKLDGRPSRARPSWDSGNRYPRWRNLPGEGTVLAEMMSLIEGFQESYGEGSGVCASRRERVTIGGPRVLGCSTRHLKEGLEKRQKCTIVNSFVTGPVDALVRSPVALLE